MANQVFSVLAVTVQGLVFDCTECTYQPSINKRETVTAMGGVVGYTEMPQAGKFTLTLLDRGNYSVQTLANLTNAEVQVLARNGKSFIGHSMWQTGEIAMSNKTGDYEVVFEGTDLREILAS